MNSYAPLTILAPELLPARAAQAKREGWCAWRVAVELGYTLEEVELAFKDAGIILPPSPRPRRASAQAIVSALAVWWRGEACMAEAAKLCGLADNALNGHRRRIGLVFEARHIAAAQASRVQSLTRRGEAKERRLAAKIRSLTKRGMRVAEIAKATGASQARLEYVASRAGVELLRHSDFVPALIEIIEAEQALPCGERRTYAELGAAAGVCSETVRIYATAIGERRIEERREERVARVLAYQADHPACCPAQVQRDLGICAVTIQRDQSRGYYTLGVGRRTRAELVDLVTAYLAEHPEATLTRAARDLAIQPITLRKIRAEHDLSFAKRGGAR